MEHAVNLNEYENTGTHWIVLYDKNNEVIYFDSFSVEYIPLEIFKFIGSKDIKLNIFIIQAYDSIMCDYFCILFIDFKFKSKSLVEFTNLFSPYNFKKKDKISQNYFKKN